MGTGVNLIAAEVVKFQGIPAAPIIIFGIVFLMTGVLLLNFTEWVERVDTMLKWFIKTKTHAF